MLEYIDSKGKDKIVIFKNITFGFSLKWFTRYFVRKNEKLLKFPHIISEVFAIILTLKQVSENDFFYTFYLVRQKTSCNVCVSAAVIRPEGTGAQTMLAT